MQTLKLEEKFRFLKHHKGLAYTFWKLQAKTVKLEYKNWQLKPQNQLRENYATN